MKTILKTYTLTQVETVKMALDAAGIAAVVQGRSLVGIDGRPYSVAVGDEDVEAAKTVLAELEHEDS